MKIKIVLILSVLCFTESKAQWKEVFKANNSGIEAIFSQGNNVVAATADGIYFSKDTGSSWQLIDTTDGVKTLSMFFEFNNSLYAISEYSGIYRSDDNGETWAKRDIGSNHFIDIANCGNVLITVGDAQIQISRDSGRTWITSNKGIQGNNMSNEGLNHIVSLGGRLLACYASGKIHYSIDTGKSWQYMGYSDAFQTASTTLGGNIYFAEWDQQIEISKDTGKSWQHCVSNNNDGFVDIKSDSTILLAAGSDDGVIVSRDSGINWVFISQGLSSERIYHVAISKDFIFCSATDGKIFRRPISEAIKLGINNESNNFPGGLIKLKVFPDPFQQSATFDFGRELKNGQIILYDISGKEVYRMDDINSGKSVIQRGELPSGNYIYLITEGNKKLASGKLNIQS